MLNFRDIVGGANGKIFRKVFGRAGRVVFREVDERLKKV